MQSSSGNLGHPMILALCWQLRSKEPLRWRSLVVLDLLLLGSVRLLLRNLGGALGLAVRVELRDTRRPVLLRLARSHDARESVGLEAARALQALLRDEALDLRGLLLLPGLAADHVLADVVLLGQVEDLADVRRTLRAETAGLVVIRKPRNFLLALLRHDELHDGEVRRGDAAANALALARTLAARAVGLHALGEEQADAVVREHALHHREALLVVPAGDLEDVALELIAEGVRRDLRGHALLVEGQELAVIVDLDALLKPRAGVADVELHGRPRKKNGKPRLPLEP